MYTSLLQSPNYVTKRQSLKLLGEILLDRTNFNVMTRYISSEENLKLMMNLLKDKSKNIQFEAFHVFKVVSLPFLLLLVKQSVAF
jgi:calcium binding protein 39